MIGPHETSFWREVYLNIEKSNVSNILESDKNQESIQVIAGSKPFDHSLLDNDLKGQWKGWESFRDTSKVHSSEASSSREIHLLKTVIQEQKLKIESLEQLLRDERSQNELKIQKLLQSHKLAFSSFRDHEDLSTDRLRADASVLTASRPFRYDSKIEENQSVLDLSSLRDDHQDKDIKVRGSVDVMNENDFMNYLDNFQSSLRRLQSRR